MVVACCCWLGTLRCARAREQALLDGVLSALLRQPLESAHGGVVNMVLLGMARAAEMGPPLPGGERAGRRLVARHGRLLRRLAVTLVANMDK